PTSNHNQSMRNLTVSTVVYRPFPTSNHNTFDQVHRPLRVVYRPFPTSNHNNVANTVGLLELYIVRFLHQTTTYNI
ncbi:MAG TPA: hypothetical protein DCL18_05070, partial [Prevotella sp.]|nr:hypothetical protein [Prevotella sp.]